MVNGFKAGTKVVIGNAGGRSVEAAVIGRVYKEMRPLPDGYVPVKFADDGARLLVHKRYIQAA